MKPAVAMALGAAMLAAVVSAAWLRKPQAFPAPPSAAPGLDGPLLEEARALARPDAPPPDARSWRALASGLRRKVRTDPAFLQELGKILLDRTEPAALREIVAFVLGSLEGVEAQRILLSALESEADPEMTRNLILALGATPDRPENDDRFDLSDAPWVVRTPSGLGVRIRQVFEDASVRAALLAKIGGSAGVRDAVVKVLIHSLAHPDVRQGFSAAFSTEPDAGIQAEIGKTLVEWVAGEGSPSAERHTFVPILLQTGIGEGAGALRLRTEGGLSAVALSAAEVGTLAPSVEAGEPGVRRWAMSVLSAQAARMDAAGRDALYASFERVARGDADAKMREFAVRSLPAFADRPEAVESMLLSLSDAAWHVRAAAAGALVRLQRDDRLLAALRRSADTDPDPRVQDAAKRAAERMETQAAPR